MLPVLEHSRGLTRVHRRRWLPLAKPTGALAPAPIQQFFLVQSHQLVIEQCLPRAVLDTERKAHGLPPEAGGLALGIVAGLDSMSCSLGRRIDKFHFLGSNYVVPCV